MSKTPHQTLARRNLKVQITISPSIEELSNREAIITKMNKIKNLKQISH